MEEAIGGKVEEGARASNSWYLLLHGNKRYIYLIIKLANISWFQRCDSGY